MTRPLGGGAVADGSNAASSSVQFTRRNIETGTEADDLCTAPALLLGTPAQPPVPMPGNDPVDRTTVAAKLLELVTVVAPSQGCCWAPVLPVLKRGPVPAPLNAVMANAPVEGSPV